MIKIIRTYLIYKSFPDISVYYIKIKKYLPKIKKCTKYMISIMKRKHFAHQASVSDLTFSYCFGASLDSLYNYNESSVFFTSQLSVTRRLIAITFVAGDLMTF